ncbi:MAG: methyltransferase domain-containing protein [Betaproteobacteria bacterium]|nr:methyltransferase domain-containing protein [Betaproteobacteria bacterium]
MLARGLLAAVALACAQAQAQAQAQSQPATVDLDTPFVTTPDAVVSAMLDLARVAPGERLVDLGSGDGRIVIEAARRGALAHGVEIDPRLVERSREAAQRAGLSARATFATQDLFETGFAQADVVTMYLLPDVNARLAPRLYATLAPGARIVSHDYGLGDWPPDADLEVDAPGKTVGMTKRSRLMLWTVPARVAGRWRGQAGEEPLALDLAQAWQHVSGTLRWRGGDYRFADRRVVGTALALDLRAEGRPPLELRLRASGDADLEGEAREGGAAPRSVSLRRMQ